MNGLTAKRNWCSDSPVRCPSYRFSCLYWKFLHLISKPHYRLCLVLFFHYYSFRGPSPRRNLHNVGVGRVLEGPHPDQDHLQLWHVGHQMCRRLFLQRHVCLSNIEKVVLEPLPPQMLGNRSSKVSFLCRILPWSCSGNHCQIYSAYPPPCTWNFHM